MKELAKPLLKLKKKTLSLKQRQAPKTLLGEYGELQAAQFLRQAGFSIVGQNILCGKVELDLVAITPDGQELVFVEVKTRGQDFSGHPSAAVSRTKLQNMKAAAKIYLANHPSSLDYRFDVITVLPGGKIEHFENVTF